MARTVLVTGATGTLGVPTVRRLLAAGHDVRALSRRERPATADGPAPVRGDLRTGEGLADAVRGADVVVHCATGVPPGRVDVEGTRRLAAAARDAGGPHLVYVSIVGVDRNPFRYYRAKLAAEVVVAGSGLPWTVLRATQFHDLIFGVLRRIGQLPLVPLPAATSFQPVAAADVADRLAELAGGDPAGRAPDFGGPAVRTCEDLARTYGEAARLHRPRRSFRLPGKVFAAFRDGHHLAPDHADGTVTWEEFLASRLGTASGGATGGATRGA